MKKLLPLLLVVACAHAPVPTVDMVKLDDCARALHGLEQRYELPRDEKIIPHAGVYKVGFSSPPNFPKTLLASSGVDVRGPGSSSSTPTFTGAAASVATAIMPITACYGFGGAVVGEACNNSSAFTLGADATGLRIYYGNQIRLTNNIATGGWIMPYTLDVTGIVTTGNDINVGFNIGMLHATGLLYWTSNASTTGGITSNMSAANAGATAASTMVKVYPQTALDATDWVFGVGTASNAASLFHVAYNGTATFAGTIEIPSASAVNWDGATGGVRAYTTDSNTLQFDNELTQIMGTATTSPSHIESVACVVTTGVGNLGASGPDDLQSCTLPANALTTTNRCFEVLAKGTTANNANAKTVRLAVGGTAVITKQLTASIAGRWTITATVCRTGASAQDYFAESVNFGGTTVSSTDGATVAVLSGNGTATETETNAIIIKTQSTASTTDNDIVSELLAVKYY